MSNDDLSDHFRQLFYELVDEESFGREELRTREFDFIFHMSDGMEGVQKLAKAFHSSESKPSLEESRKAIYLFFIHGLNHMEAAKRIALPEEPNPFLDSKSEGQN